MAKKDRNKERKRNEGRKEENGKTEKLKGERKRESVGVSGLVCPCLVESHGPLTESFKRETFSPLSLSRSPFVISPPCTTLNSVALQTDKFREDYQRCYAVRGMKQGEGCRAPWPRNVQGKEGGVTGATASRGVAGGRVARVLPSAFLFLLSPVASLRSPVIYRCLGVRSLRNYVPPRPLVNGL